MQHTPKLHIFVGRDNHFFTLRESYLHTYYIGQVNPKPVYEIRYSHIKNLSQNWEEAVEKAHEASKQFGVQLHVRASEIEQLDEIKRISAEEAEQQKRLLQEENAKAEAEALERRIKWWNQWVNETLNTLEGTTMQELNVSHTTQPAVFFEKIAELGYVQSEFDPEIYVKVETDNSKGRMVGGAHHNTLLTSVPRSYLQWLVYTSGLCEIEDVQFNKMAFVAQWIRDNIEIPEIKESNWVGEVKEKIELEVEIDSVRTLAGHYGYTYLYKLIDSEGNQLTWFASSPALKDQVGKIKLKFTVKAHNEYQGAKQTVITRAKVI